MGIELSIFHGGKHNNLMLAWQFPIGRASLVFDPAKAGSANENGAVALRYVIKALNDEVNFIVTKKIKKNIDELVKAEFNKNAGVLKNKTLLIDKAYVGTWIKDKALKAYKYQYQVVDVTEMVSLLNSDPSKYCFMGGDMYISMEIYDGETKSLVYSQYKKMMMAGAVKEDQIKELNAAIDKK
jgi:hypothetical protein